MSDLDTVRAVLQQMLTEFTKQPFFDLRESAPQAQLFGLLRQRIDPPDVPLRLAPHSKHSHTFPAAMRTSRVQRELKIEEWKLDSALLRADGDVEFKVHANGPLDILASTRGDDLVAAIEVKAAPSRNMWGAFRDDLAKLSSITSIYPKCHGFFLAFDKSIALGGSSSKISATERWLEELVPDPNGLIEAHYLGLDGKPACRRGRFVGS
jgi:hypothetical protein